MAGASHKDIARVSGPDSMAAPQRANGSTEGSSQNAAAAGAAAGASAASTQVAKKKRHRAGRKKNKKRQSFAAPSEATEEPDDINERPSLVDVSRNSAQQTSFYRLQAGNHSNTSLESEALLDHRDHGVLGRRRQSLQQGFGRSSMPYQRYLHRQSGTAQHQRSGTQVSRLSHAQAVFASDDDEDEAHDRTPLLAHSNHPRLHSKPDVSRTNSGLGYGSHGSHRPARRPSNQSRASSRRPYTDDDSHDVNNPPSMPTSPQAGPVDDVFGIADPGDDLSRDVVIDIDSADLVDRRYSDSSDGVRRRQTAFDLAERDVCFPADAGMSELGEESDHMPHDSQRTRRRRHARFWPDLEILNQWSGEEKEARTQQDILRAKKISEPLMVDGRLRARKAAWHREQENEPFRFTYFNETLDGTIHSPTISGLTQDGLTFKEMFVPDPIELSDSSDDDDDERDQIASPRPRSSNNGDADLERTPTNATTATRTTTATDALDPHSTIKSQSPHISSQPTSGQATPTPTVLPRMKRKRHANPPSFWLDVLNPSAAEVMVLGKAFGIHQLTIEDINEQESREKVELFQSYYFVNYRTFEQDTNSEDYMEPINVYVVVFREGVISFHHSQCPHFANVRRRIRQLGDYLSPSADWISYGIIDNITDAYAPLVAQIEQEVDEIDEKILTLHTTFADKAVPAEKKTKDQRPRSSRGSLGGNAVTQADMGAAKTEGEKTTGESGGDMLRRVGECRKKVMGLYRLLGNKADVIKGFAKRCNESWDVAPRSEIGLYLGDIQDHIVTMTANLSHYESLLSRAHGNYVAQINIRMNERAEQNADVLGKLTVLGTIVLPMNIITGMWGMNVWVPGQDHEGDLTWFFAITAGLVAFGLTSYFIAKKVYGIV